MSEWMRARARRAGTGRGTEQEQEEAAEQLMEYVRRAIDEAPPLNERQNARLAALFVACRNRVDGR